MSIRYYLYISDVKVDMLLSQIDPSFTGRRTTEAGMSLKLFSFKRSVEASMPDRVARLERVLKHMREHERTGSVDDPGPYFLGPCRCSEGHCAARAVGRRCTSAAEPRGRSSGSVEPAAMCSAGALLQTLRGLHYAHTAEVPVRLSDGTVTTSHGLVHRDIKPQNLLLTGDRERMTLKIAEFGLAKAFDSAGLSGHTLTGAFGGSLAFMPRGQVIDFKYARPEIDLWAVTACLYWMLTGSAPRDFPPDADPVAVVLREPPVPVRDRVPSLPRRLAELIDRPDRPAPDHSHHRLRPSERHPSGHVRRTQGPCAGICNYLVQHPVWLRPSWAERRWAGARRHLRSRSSLTTTRAHGLTAMRAIRDELTGTPGLLPTATRAPVGWSLHMSASNSGS